MKKKDTIFTCKSKCPFSKNFPQNDCMYHFEENTIQITLLGMKIYLHFSTQSRFLVQQLSTDLQQ